MQKRRCPPHGVCYRAVLRARSQRRLSTYAPQLKPPAFPLMFFSSVFTGYRPYITCSVCLCKARRLVLRIPIVLMKHAHMWASAFRLSQNTFMRSPERSWDFLGSRERWGGGCLLKRHGHYLPTAGHATTFALLS
eukprot:663744-Pleurochrysis_carterae.AAC.1